MKTLLSGMLLLVVLQLAAKPANRLDRDKLHNKVLTQNSDPEVVATLSDRDAIPMAMRNELMYCYVADNHKVYQLKGGVSNAHWVELDIASTLKIQGPAGSLPYIDATGLLATDLRYLGKSKYDFSGANSLGQGQYLNVNGVGNTINDKSHNILNSFNSYSNGSYVVILGERDTVMGNHSTALGSQISLQASHQFASGLGLKAMSEGEVVMGQYNTSYTTNGNGWHATDRLFTLGNGTSLNNRQDALVIYKSGDAVFSGSITAANLYSKLEVDSLIINSGGASGVVQSLNLSGSQLSITGSNSVNFAGWDTDASNDFSGNYTDLTNKPTLFSGDYTDLTNKPTLFSGDYTDLVNTPNFNNWDQDASDDFSGSYNDLTQKPSFTGWDQNAADDFSGDYADLSNKPVLFSGNYNDLANLPNFNGWDTDASDDFSGSYSDLTQKPQLFSGNYNDLTNLPNLYTQNQVDSAIAASGASASQSLSLSGTQLSISGGNTINFNKWDTNVLDDFSGNYNDLTNKPTLFTGNYNDLTNTPSFNGWDTDASDDFSGDYNDLVNVPNFSNWDQNAADDFSGDFSDLNNLPALYTKSQVDSAIGANAGSGGIAQTLSLSGSQLSITGGNNVNFGNWDTDASDDFSGNFIDLNNIPTDLQDGQIAWNEVASKPLLYTRNQVDSIRQGVVDSMTNYVDSAVISQAHSQLVANRSLQVADCGKTIYVKGSTSILTVPANANIPFNSHIELRDFGSGSLILDASAVTLRDEFGDVITNGTANLVVLDVAITSLGNNEFKIIGLYQ